MKEKPDVEQPPKAEIIIRILADGSFYMKGPQDKLLALGLLCLGRANLEREIMKPSQIIPATEVPTHVH